MVLGICDVAGKYYVPQIGGSSFYFLMVALMIFPAGVVRGRTVSDNRGQTTFANATWSVPDSLAHARKSRSGC